MKQNFEFKYDRNTKKKWIETHLTGKDLLSNSILNKGTAFNEKERFDFGILGKLPAKEENLNEQVQRAYEQYQRFDNDLQKNVYLNRLHDTNEVLFYKLALTHIEDVMPVIYTPIVGDAVQKFSHKYRSERGLYITYDNIDHIEQIISNRTHDDIKIIVISDAEAILGIGDQGVGGMDIPIAKIIVYTLCGGINPSQTLPILLDVGTDNEDLLNDPMYLGWRHKRLRGEKYFALVEKFINTIKKQFPYVYLHWEDFASKNARILLDKYKDEICSFNDDVQGTGIVATAAILAGIKTNHQQINEQRIVIFGAGAAGVGVADQIVDAFCQQGLSEEEALKHFWLIDKEGLIVEGGKNIQSFQKRYARKIADIDNWEISNKNYIGLLDVTKNIKPTILIGCSAVPGAFSELVITLINEQLHENIRPIIMPLSNPTEKSEAKPEDIINWTNGRALIATGSPFPHITWQNKTYEIAQSNNALVFPGLGLGIMATQAKKVTNNILWAACLALSEMSPINKSGGTAALLPSITDSHRIATHIAQAVAIRVWKDNLNGINFKNEEEIIAKIEELIWQPEYLELIKK